ncbi:unnamed protein product [Linum trigynum]|uniref:Uncharacterized protein n=1 Tax=Linum trigynum TaxID=586398 RepID=A0AAV2FWE0_9ROSI
MEGANRLPAPTFSPPLYHLYPLPLSSSASRLLRSSPIQKLAIVDDGDCELRESGGDGELRFRSQGKMNGGSGCVARSPDRHASINITTPP